jgi:hypothetical protein
MTQKNSISPHVAKAFFAAFDDNRRAEHIRQERMKKIAANKQQILAPVKHFLQTLTTMGVHMRDGRSFTFYEKESSPSWQPGVSLLFDHPIPVEIAIPNTPKEGAIVIRCPVEHPDVQPLEKHFNSVEDGLAALASFLGKHTQQLEIDPRNRAETMAKLQKKRESAQEFHAAQTPFVDVSAQEETK